MLVRAPYSSGKTSLAQLIHYSLKPKAYIISLVGANGYSWEAFWKKEMRVDWETIAAIKVVVYIIIDEVQISYHKDSKVYSLWDAIKTLANSNPLVKFICFGAYGTPAGMISTPIEFPVTITFTRSGDTPGMAYTNEDFAGLCAKFGSSAFTIDAKAANYLYYMTNGYPGIIGWILVQASTHFKNKRGISFKKLQIESNLL